MKCRKPNVLLLHKQTIIPLNGKLQYVYKQMFLYDILLIKHCNTMALNNNIRHQVLTQYKCTTTISLVNCYNVYTSCYNNTYYQPYYQYVRYNNKIQHRQFATNITHNNNTLQSTLSSSSTLPLSIVYKLRNLFGGSNTIVWSCAYGSAVFKQYKSVGNNNTNTQEQDTLLDIIIVVDDSIKFHKYNRIHNKSHYSFIARLLPIKLLIKLQQYGGNIYFNTDVALADNIRIKYGIIDINDMYKDLNEYDSIYISGRLHKPVKILNITPNPQQYNTHNNELLQHALQSNLTYALTISLLLLTTDPAINNKLHSTTDTITIDEKQLYTTICGLSYTGDIRMRYGENPNKVNNIVNNNLQHFIKLYRPIIQQDMFSNIIQPINNNTTLKQINNNNTRQTTQYRISTSKDARHQLLSFLPLYFEYELCELERGLRVGNKSNDIVLRLLAYDRTDNEVHEQLQQALQRIVEDSSFKQSVKGIVTAGIYKSIKYALAKVKKAIQART